MRIIRTKHIPFGRFIAMNFFGIILYREGYVIQKNIILHEKVHSLQMKELLYVGFYVLYLLEWIFRGFSYRNISFEREARWYQWDLHREKQLMFRRKFGWKWFFRPWKEKKLISARQDTLPDYKNE